MIKLLILVLMCVDLNAYVLLYLDSICGIKWKWLEGHFKGDNFTSGLGDE